MRGHFAFPRAGQSRFAFLAREIGPTTALKFLRIHNTRHMPHAALLCGSALSPVATGMRTRSRLKPYSTLHLPLRTSQRVALGALPYPTYT